MDADLAALTYDSGLDHVVTGAVRGPEDLCMLTFEAPALTVEVEVTAMGARRRLVGQLVPAQRALVIVRHRHGSVTVEADELGRFRVHDLPAGLTSLRCHLSGSNEAASTVTDWVML